MVEENKEKVAPPTAPVPVGGPPAPGMASVPSAAVATAQKPPVPVARAAPTPPPASKQAVPNVGRRMFVKFAVTVGALLAVIPFVPWGSFLTSSSQPKLKKQKVVVDNKPEYGPAAGKIVNVNDLDTFPPNQHWAITYPSSGDLTIDTQNPDTFLKFELIRLPSGDFGGGAKSAAAFVAFSKVCVHLWCSPNYNSKAGHLQYECPCHGSIYELPDGVATAGPAAIQPAPTNAIPMLTLTQDSDGVLYAEVHRSDPLKDEGSWDLAYNGIPGYGRNSDTYRDYIKPAAEGTA